jgi:Flp pilus assembly pilin Flp
LVRGVYHIRRFQVERDHMKTSNVAIRKLIVDESGQALAEYSLLITFIAAVCVIAVTALGLAVATGFGGILPAF